MLLGWLMFPLVAPLLEHTMGIPPEYGRHILILAAASGLAGFFYQRSRIRLDEEDLRQCLTHPDLQPAERAYLKSLLALAEGTGWSKQTVSQVARELGTLLDTYYHLQQWLERWCEAKGDPSEEEYTRLHQRLLQTQDSTARQTLQESLQLLEQRVQSQRALAACAQRVEAHLELILQALQSVQQTLARAQLVPEAMDDFDAEQLRQGVLALRQEATAIENAIQEVLTLRTPSGA